MNHDRSHPDRERGFILIGVVMMALALTILALSLFSLSGYEAQFYTRSTHLVQAQQTALGEIDLARHRLICRPYRLENVGTQLPPGIELDAWQIQNGDTARSGPVDWDHDQNISITARVTASGITTEASGLFRPTAAPNYYKRLITSADSVTINVLGSDATNRANTVQLLGDVWQNNSDVSWQALDAPGSPSSKLGGVPLPDIQTYLDQPAPEEPSGGNTNIGGKTWLTIALTGGLGGQVNYYRHHDEDTDGFTYDGLQPTVLNVTGRVVWMFKLGLRMRQRFWVVGQSPDACLIIVASPNRVNPGPPSVPAPNMGIWLQGGIECSNIPVFLVSDGGVYIDSDNDGSSTLSTFSKSLSIFARDVRLTGPQAGTNAFAQMQYAPAVGNPLIDELAEQSPPALPNMSPSGNYRLPLVPGTWAMTTP